MRVQDLQQLLSEFTDKLKGNAISDAKIYVAKDGYLEEIRRIEVHEHGVPIIGHKGHTAHRLVLKTVKESPLIMPTKLKDDY